mmetsp:Transcript_35253/g.58927  ORF Transcript_35253/g.58927 Transcript_35253/m.58927 type:complete len:218 (-) Transcript_35253:586-1239(-)
MEIDTIHSVQLSDRPQPSVRRINAYIRFSNVHRRILKSIYPSLNNRQISSLLGSIWNKLPTSFKEPFIEASKLEASQQPPSPSQASMVPQDILAQLAQDHVSSLLSQSQHSEPSPSKTPSPDHPPSAPYVRPPFESRCGLPSGFPREQRHPHQSYVTPTSAPDPSYHLTLPPFLYEENNIRQKPSSISCIEPMVDRWQWAMLHQSDQLLRRPIRFEM